MDKDVIAVFTFAFLLISLLIGSMIFSVHMEANALLERAKIISQNCSAGGLEFQENIK
jgi:hypothetical protein